MKLFVKALVVVCLYSLTSCITSKKVIYWQDAVPTTSTQRSSTDTSSANDTSANEDLSLRIQPFDVLDIHIKSSKQALDDLLQTNLPTIYAGGGSGSQAGQGAGANATGGYFSGFLVDATGAVQLPVLGRVYLKNLTVIQAKNLLSERAKEYINSPYIDIKFLTFKVYVLGNVRNPGTITISNEKANLIEALAMANDLSDVGNSKRIKILRGDLKKNYKTYLVDMTSLKSVRESEAFYLKPNDIIYVEPLGRKFFLSNLTAILSFVTIVNTSLIIYRLFSNGQ